MATFNRHSPMTLFGNNLAWRPRDTSTPNNDIEFELYLLHMLST